MSSYRAPDGSLSAFYRTGYEIFIFPILWSSKNCAFILTLLRIVDEKCASKMFLARKWVKILIKLLKKPKIFGKAYQLISLCPTSCLRMGSGDD